MPWSVREIPGICGNSRRGKGTPPQISGAGSNVLRKEEQKMTIFWEMGFIVLFGAFLFLLISK
jgi:hypothetical protein